MKRWAILVIVFYAVILAWLLFLGVPAALGAGPSLSDLTGLLSPAVGREEAFVLGLWASWVAVMTLCQAGLLVVPVRLAGRKPVKKRHVIWPILVGSFSLLAMGVAMGLAVAEFLSDLKADGFWIVPALATVGAVWLIWGVIFGFYCGRHEPRTLLHRLVRMLIAGSILELLVAVPAHVYCRTRDHCCGGFLTIWGLGLGLSVMLFAFGPGVFMLFVRRCASLGPEAGRSQGEVPEKGAPGGSAS